MLCLYSSSDVEVLMPQDQDLDLGQASPVQQLPQQSPTPAEVAAPQEKHDSGASYSVYEATPYPDDDADVQ